MAKRLSDNLPPTTKKVPRSSGNSAGGTAQSTLHRFYKSSSDTQQKKATTLHNTPQILGIHTYSDEDILQSTGSDRQYKEFWNDKV